MPDSSANPTTARPLRRISSWKVFGIFCLIAFTILVGVVFIPWDIKPVVAPDLEIQIPKIASEENAFTWFEKAGQALVQKFPADAAGDKRDWSALLGKSSSLEGKWDPAFAAEVLTANATAFRDLETGLACQRYVSLQQKSIEGLQPWMQRHKALVQLLCLKSKQAQLAGDPAGAVKAALQGWRFGQLVIAGNRSRFEWLVGVGCESIALERLEELAADAKTPAPVLAEIQVGLAEWKIEAFNNGYKNTMRGEFENAMLRVQAMHETGMRGENPQDKPVKMRNTYFFKPNMMRRDLAAFFRHQVQMADLPRTKVTADYPGKPADSASGLRQLRLLLRPNGIGTILLQMEIPPIEKAMLQKFRLQANVELLRLQIALRRYELKYGQLPDQLQSLVPKFIPALPNDPMDDRPFRYSKTDDKLWSVGDDGIDNGGKIDGKSPCLPRKGFDMVAPTRPGWLEPERLPSESKEAGLDTPLFLL